MTHDLLPLWRQEFAPIWKAADECGAIVHLHTIGPPIDPRHATTERERASWVGGWLTVFQLRMIERVAELIFGGILHAYENMRVVIGESGIGWLPYVLERMDDQWSQRFTHLELTMPPSGYWQRQMAATFQVDEAGLLLADRIGGIRTLLMMYGLAGLMLVIVSFGAHSAGVALVGFMLTMATLGVGNGAVFQLVHSAFAKRSA